MQEPLLEEIPAAFYSQILGMISSLPQEHMIWSTCELILQHAFERLDPHHQGVALLITQCIPPSRENKVRSLRSIMGRGIAPWGGNVQNQSTFLGADTVPGQVVSSGQPIIVQNYQDVRQIGHESRAGVISSCTYPLMRAARIAGTFGAVTTLPEYFLPSRQALIQDYAKLISTVFAFDAFYNLQDIELHIMPSAVVQLPYIVTLQKRIHQIMSDSTRSEAIVYSQAEQLAWQQLEEELLQVALLDKSEPSL